MSTDIQTIDLPELICIGIAVVASPAEFPQAVAEAFETLYSTETDATAFLKISQAAPGDQIGALVGYLAARKTKIPDGLERVSIPAGQYLRLLHRGPLSEIDSSFRTLHEHAAAMGAETTGMTLDFGYLPGLADTPHELNLQLAPKPLLLG